MSEISSKPTLSVVIPVYNVEKYVKAAVDSVLEQTVAPDEIIIVDDGATDNSGALIEQLYAQYEHVTIVHTPNAGLGEARNVGTRLAKSDFIYYFDSDDLLKNNLVEVFQDAVGKNPDLDIFVFSAESFYDKDVLKSGKKMLQMPEYNRGMEHTYTDGETAFCGMSQNAVFFPNAWLYIYRRDLQKHNNLFFKPIIHEDEEFTPRLFFNAKKVVVTAQSFFERRLRSGSIMQTRRGEGNAIGYLQSIKALQELYQKTDNAESKRHLLQRIKNNMFIIIHIRSEVNFSQSTEDEYKKLMMQYQTPLMRVASINFFSYRVLRGVLRQLKLVEI
ncbi:glycosyltransferase [Pantoea sp. B65]|uniref:glycosyltransferase n=1 Tax=Pantoea sp. B65 TaxID=2813359 RepID=UPI0039B66944